MADQTRGDASVEGTVTLVHDAATQVGVAMTDIATGLYAHGAILAALLARSSTGRGQHVACSLAATQLSCLINHGTAFLNAGHVARARGSSHDSLVPYEAFPTSDGHLTVGAGTDAHFKALARLVGLPELADDPRYCDNASRVANRETLTSSLKEAFKKRSTSDWLATFKGSAFPHGAVCSVAEALESPLAKGRVYDVGGVRLVGPAVDFSESENCVRSAPPGLGQHTDDVLRQEVPTLRLHLRKPQPKKSVQWGQGTVDNEHMNKKKSKCCCQFEKARAFDESSSEDDDDDCDNCSGHTDKKKPAADPSPTQDPAEAGP